MIHRRKSKKSDLILKSFPTFENHCHFNMIYFPFSKIALLLISVAAMIIVSSGDFSSDFLMELAQDSNDIIDVMTECFSDALKGK